MRPNRESDVFHAIAHPARRCNLLDAQRWRAARQASSPSRFTSRLRQSRSTLRVSKKLELVSVRREGPAVLPVVSEATA